ncbi:MAG: hypothetical protein LBS96_07695 [Oscillospiraceae bacterium]|jgi:hypothetical protein|nr:hypothetical protein [Oscillospiraceae bacterium]
MVNVRAGNYVYQLLQLLALAGEFPAASLCLLGNERVIKALVHRLESVQEMRFSTGGQVYVTKLLQVSGQRERRTVHLHRSTLPLLQELHSEASAYYLDTFQGHKFSGSEYHITRNHRVAEAIAVAMMAGLEFRPYVLPKLQNSAILHTVPTKPSFYIARDFKETESDGMNKTMFTRIVGAVFYTGGCYAVYNTRGAVMKWAGMGEFKAMHYLSELARRNAGLSDVNSALLLGNNPDVALQTILESDKNRRALRFDGVYQHVHFLPLNPDGIRLLKLLTLPNWNEKIRAALFSPEMRPQGFGFMEYDAVANGTFILSHLDGDLARLIRFREALPTQVNKHFEVVCFPWQQEYLHAYLGDSVKLRLIEMEALEHEII